MASTYERFVLFLVQAINTYILYILCIFYKKNQLNFSQWKIKTLTGPFFSSPFAKQPL